LRVLVAGLDTLSERRAAGNAILYLNAS